MFREYRQTSDVLKDEQMFDASVTSARFACDIFKHFQNSLVAAVV
jgi:hypothetical protein